MTLNMLRTQVSTEEFDVVCSNIMSFHSIQSLIIAKLKTNQASKLYEYNTDASSDGNECQSEWSKQYIQQKNNRSKSVKRQINIAHIL